MKRFLLHLAAFGALCAIMLFLICFVIPFRVIGEQDYNMGILDKIARLKATEATGKPRLILVGGSNLAFGIDSEKIQQETGLQVVNMGIAAGQGLGYILHTLKPHLRDGDIVILAAEYGFFAGGWHGSHERLIYMLDIHRESIFSLIQPGFLGWPTGIDKYINWKFYRVVTHPHRWGSIGSRSWWNEYGDRTGHLGLPPVPFNVHQGEMDPDRIDSFSIAALSNYIDRVQKNYPHTTFLLSFPAIERQSYLHYSPIVPELVERVTQTGFTRISDPLDYVFEYEEFHDSIWHLRQEPRQVRTERLIRDYLAWTQQRDQTSKK